MAKLDRKILVVYNSISLKEDDTFVICNSENAIILRLPAATGSTTIYYITNVGSGVVTVSADAADTIGNGFTQTLSQWASMNIIDVTVSRWIQFGSSNVSSSIQKLPTQVINLVAESTYTLTTTLTEDPISIMILDSSGNLITDSLTVSYSMATGVCVLSIYSSANLVGTKVKIIY